MTRGWAGKKSFHFICSVWIFTIWTYPCIICVVITHFYIRYRIERRRAKKGTRGPWDRLIPIWEPLRMSKKPSWWSFRVSLTNTWVAAYLFVRTDVPGPVGSTATHGHTASPLSSLRAHPPSDPTNRMTSFQALSNADDQHVVLKRWLETCLLMESNKSYQKMPNAPSWIIAILSRPKCLIFSLLNKLCRAHFC